MRDLWRRRTRSMLCALSASMLMLSLSGCAVPSLHEPSDPQPLPAQWRELQSPGAKAFSEKVRTFLPKAERYFNEMPRFTTPSSEPQSLEKCDTLKTDG